MALRPVEIAIRAKDQTKAGVQSATTGLERFAAAQAKTNARRRQMQTLVDDAQALGTAYQAAAARANELGQKIANAKRPSKALREEFAAARVEARRLRDEAGQAVVAGMRMTGQVGKPGSFAQFDEIATGAKRAEMAVESETNALNANTGALRRNAAASRGAGGARGGGKADLASRITGAAATRNDRGPLGLRPYELQNLSYQVNDFFTQIASGTPVTQAFAQQFGQVAQLFPKAISGFIRFIPIIGLAAVALAPFVTKLAQANNEAKNLKTMELLLTRSGEAATYNAEQLAKTAASLDKYGASADGARAAVSRFVTDSIDPGYLERFGKTAINMSKALGIDLAGAAEKVSTSFAGNVDAIISLDDELNFLTDAERTHILKLKESKKEAEARTYAFGIFERRYQETANKMKGPWSSILSDFNAAWQGFVNFVNFIDFAKARRQIDDLTSRIQRLTRLLPGANKRGAENAQATRERNFREIERLEEQQAAARRRNGGRDNVALANRIALLRREQAEIRGIIDEYLAAERAAAAVADPADTTTDPPPIEPDKPNNDAQQAAERRAQLLDDLLKSNEARAFEANLIGVVQRETRILSEIEATRLQFAEEGMTLSAQQTASIRESVGALYDAEQAERARGLIAQASLELAEARGEVEEEAAYVVRKAREAGFEVLSETNALTNEVTVSLTAEESAYRAILRQIYRINDATRQREAAEKSVNDLTGLRSDLLQQIEFYEDAGQQGTADLLREQLMTVNAELTLAVDNAINFWTAMGGEGSEAALLRLSLLRDQLAGIGEKALFSGKQINDMIADGATTAFDQFAQSIAEGESLIGSLRDAFLQFAADFLRQIAQMIIKQAILNALQASQGGGGGGGGGIASFLNSLFGSAGVKHDGGVIGSGGPSRSVNMAAFIGAMRYHSGGVIGLKPNERPIIAEDGEEMLTEDDPRHRNNLKGGASTKILNVLDGPDLLQHALVDERGQQVLFNFVRANSGAFKAVLG